MVRITYFISKELRIREFGEAPRRGTWERVLAKRLDQRGEARQYVLRLMHRNAKKGYVSTLVED